MTQIRFLQNRSFSRPDLGLGGSFLMGQVVVGVDAATARRLADAGIVEIIRPSAPVVDRPDPPTTREEGMVVTAREEPAQDWRSLSWPQKRSLASQQTDEPIRTMADAERVLADKFG
jgi:hypothetical protein